MPFAHLHLFLPSAPRWVVVASGRTMTAVLVVAACR